MAVQSKDTKNAIWEAYQELLGKYQQLEASKMGFSHSDSSPARTPPKASDFFEGIEHLKKQFLTDLDTYSSRARETYDVIDVLSEELRTLESRLKEGEKIQTEVSSLYALIELQQKKKREFEEEMAEKGREAKQQELEWQYRFDEKKRAEEYAWKQKREESEQQWNIEIEKKTARLSLRETEIDAKASRLEELERENAELRSSLESLPHTLELSYTEKLTEQFTTEKRFFEKEWEMKEALFEVERKNLEEKITDLHKQNIELTKNLTAANARMESFASKIVESGRPIMMGGGKEGV